MATKIATLRPGILVALRTSVRGNVKYTRKDLDTGSPIEQDGSTAQIARWETERMVEDPVELEAATKARGKARSLIASVCAGSDFGLLCPADREARLDAAIIEAHRIIDAFNEDATRTVVALAVLKGRIAADDAEALVAINGELRELMERMERGVLDANPEAIRDAAAKARSMEAMLSAEAQLKVATAIEQARMAARELTRRVVKGGELAATVVAELRMEAIAAARITFLDLEPSGIMPEAIPTAPRALDLEN